MSKRGGQGLPAGWPANVVYTPILNTDNKDVEPNLRNRIRKLLARYQSELKRPVSKNVKIKVINDPRHPAFGQRGLFAARRLEPREWIIDYAGELLPDSSEQTDASDYCLKFAEKHSIDAWKMGNEARFLNDFRGVPNFEKPNVQFADFELPTKPADIAILGFRVLHEPIRKGDELLTSYGKGFWEKRGLIDSKNRDATTCPGRHGLKPFRVTEGSSYLCFPCSVPVDANAEGFQFCERCNYGVCSTCRASASSKLE